MCGEAQKGAQMGLQTHDCCVFSMHIPQKDLSGVIGTSKVKEAPASASQPKSAGLGDIQVSIFLSSSPLEKGGKVSTLNILG